MFICIKVRNSISIFENNEFIMLVFQNAINTLPYLFYLCFSCFLQLIFFNLMFYNIFRLTCTNKFPLKFIIMYLSEETSLFIYNDENSSIVTLKFYQGNDLYYLKACCHFYWKMCSLNCTSPAVHQTYSHFSTNS